jgi:hypothetical protein
MTDYMTDPSILWRRPAGVAEGEDCIETAELPDGTIGVRSTADLDAGIVVFTRAEIDAFVKGVKAGEFDDLAE